MRFPFFLALLTSLGTCVRAQQTYFQQDLDYTIEAQLDDKNHVLHATMTLRYRNNSPDTLRVIPFHVWPRAYSSDKTALAKQLLRQGNTRFHFSERERRGTLDSLDYYVNGQPAGHTFSDAQPDVSILLLNQPVLPGETIQIETPFRVKIPSSFSRLGHVGESYQMTQWYPKPAVYDRAGWHVMPYLDRGEFYGEFGNFTVRLTLPDNYVVGATGTMPRKQREKMIKRAIRDRTDLANRRDLGSDYVAERFPASSATMKTLEFRAENVHDFAWFADKRFKVLHDTLPFAGQLPFVPGAVAGATNGIEERGTVDVWALFTETEADLWKEATDYLKRAVRFYSERVGRYPYPQVTGVQSALSAGGGMEYPMITVIGRSYTAAALDEVLTHEVGHNWFYGVLGSNERDHPWMDEGLNSYYEQRYMRKYYPGRSSEQPIVGKVDYHRLGYLLTARLGQDQAPDTRSDSLSPMNYWIGAYSKPALAMHELASYVTTDSVDRAMRAYYERWKFRHPQPEDFFAVMNESLERDLDPWFAEGFTTTKTSDWKFRLSQDPPYVHQGERRPPSPAAAAAVTRHQLDLHPRNDWPNAAINTLRFGTAQEELMERQFFYLPLAGYNLNDGVQLGAALHNRTLEPRIIEWAVAPLYGFGSGKLTGFAGAQYRIARPFRKAELLNVALGTQRWSDFTLARTDEAYSYQRTALRAELTFDHPPITEQESSLTLQLIDLDRQRPSFAGDTLPSGTVTRGNVFVRLGYRSEWARELNPFGYSVHLEYKNRDESRSDAFEAGHLRLEAEVTGAKQYEPNRFVRWRLFGGYFLADGLRESSFNAASGFSLVDNAASDYRYDGLYLGRGARAGNWAEQQLGRRQGGFRAPISPAFGFGRSNTYLAAVNLDADLPLRELPLPLVAFFDGGYYGAKATANDPVGGEFNWVGGAGLSVFQGRVGVYLPLIADPDTRDLLKQRGSLLDRLSFRLSLAGWAPWRWVDGLL